MKLKINFYSSTYIVNMEDILSKDYITFYRQLVPSVIDNNAVKRSNELWS